MNYSKQMTMEDVTTKMTKIDDDNIMIFVTGTNEENIKSSARAIERLVGKPVTIKFHEKRETRRGTVEAYYLFRAITHA